MSNKKISVDELAKTIVDTVEDYFGVSEYMAMMGVSKTATEAMEELRDAHPSGSEKYGSWDDYNRGWTVKETKRDKEKHWGAQIHNKDHYQLTHLLEKGHALVNGGRTRAFTHIAPVADKCDSMLLQNIKKQLERMD